MRVFFVYFLLIFAVLNLTVNAQSKRKKWKAFEIYGKFEVYRGSTKGAKVTLLRNDKILEDNIAKNGGRFQYDLEFNFDYVLKFSKDRYITKSVYISTYVPQEIAQRDNRFPGLKFTTTIYPIVEGADYSIFDEPIAGILYDKSIDDFDFDKSFNIEKKGKIEEIEKEIVENIENLQITSSNISILTTDTQTILKSKPISKIPPVQQEKSDNQITDNQANKEKIKYQNFIAKGDLHLKKGEWNKAIIAYEAAKNINNKDDYPKLQIDKINNKIKSIAKTFSKDQDYLLYIQKADIQYDAKDWTQSKTMYEKALEFKPNSEYAVNQLKKINAQIQQAEADEKKITPKKEEPQPNQEPKPERITISAPAIKMEEKITLIDNNQEFVPTKLLPSSVSPVKPPEQKEGKYFVQKTYSQPIENRYYIKKSFQARKKKSSNYYIQRNYNPRKVYIYYYEKKEFAQPKDNQYYMQQTFERKNDKNRYNPISIQHKNNNRYYAEKSFDERIKSRYTNFKSYSVYKYEDYDSYIQKANLAIEQKNYHLANTYYSKALNEKPDDDYAHNQIITIKNLFKDSFEEKKKNEFVKLMNRGNEQINKNEYAAARFYFLKALQTNVDNTLAENKIRELEDIIILEKQNKLTIKANSYIDLAINAEKNSKYGLAKMYYQKAWELTPSSEDLLQKIADMHNYIKNSR